MDERLYAHLLEYINRERCSDEEQCECEALLCYAFDCEANFAESRWGDEIGVEQDCHDEEEDEPGNTYFLGFTLEDECCDELQRDNPECPC